MFRSRKLSIITLAIATIANVISICICMFGLSIYGADLATIVVMILAAILAITSVGFLIIEVMELCKSYEDTEEF